MQKKTLKTRTSNIHAQHNSTPFTNIFTNYYIRKTQLIWQNLDIHNDKTMYYTHYIFRRNKDKYTGSGKEIAGTGKESQETGKKSTGTGKKNSGISKTSLAGIPNGNRTAVSGKAWTTYIRTS